jgi:hypothetical protein
MRDANAHAYAKIANVSLTPGTSVSFAAGAGGAGGVFNRSQTNPGQVGGDTWFCSAAANCSSINDQAMIVDAKGGGAGPSARPTPPPPVVVSGNYGDSGITVTVHLIDVRRHRSYHSGAWPVLPASSSPALHTTTPGAATAARPFFGDKDCAL